MFEQLLGPANYDWTVIDARSAALPGRPEDYDGYLITGSAAGVYDPDPWIAQTKTFLQAAKGKAAIVGVCFGHQLMAEAFGGRVIKSPKGWGVGLHTYTLTAPTDWIEAGAGTVTLPVSHQDQVVELAASARVIGGSDFCPNGFIAYPDRKAASVQAHPEFDPAFAEALLVARSDGPLSPELTDSAIASLKGANDNARVGGWLKRFLRGDGQVGASILGA
jgi:GMP synthase-like glutamine amidotransferase